MGENLTRAALDKNTLLSSDEGLLDIIIKNLEVFAHNYCLDEKEIEFL